MDKNIKRDAPRWNGGNAEQPPHTEGRSSKDGRPLPVKSARSRKLSGLSGYEETNAESALDDEQSNGTQGGRSSGGPRRRALSAAPSGKHRALEARKGPVDRFAEEQIARLNAELDAAGAGIAAAIHGAPTFGMRPSRSELPIVGARELPLKPFVHATPDSYAMIAQKDPAYFARARLDENGTLHVQDVTRSYDDQGRQIRVAGLNSPDFIDNALRKFGENQVREIKWRWDGSGDSFAQFGQSVSQQAGFRQAIESTHTGQRLLRAGFRVTHSEIAASHLGASGPVYDAIDVRWEKADAAPSESERRGAAANRVADLDFDAIAKLPPQERFAALQAAAKGLAQQSAEGAGARIEIDACTPEIAQCIADCAYVPVTVTGTLLDGQSAVYLPRMTLTVGHAATFDQVAWLAHAWMTRHSLPPNGFVIDRQSAHPDVRKWMQALADHTGAPVSWPREMQFWGDEETVKPQQVPGGSLDRVQDARRLDDSTMVLTATLPEESELPRGEHAPLGTIASIDSVRALDQALAGINSQLQRAGSAQRIRTICTYDPTGAHSRALAQAIADQYGVVLEVASGPTVEQHRVFVAGRGGTTAEARSGAVTTRYEPRTRCEAVRGSVREFADHLRENAALSSSGIVIHPDSLPASWREMKNTALQTLSDMLNVPVALARFEGSGSSVPDSLAEAAGATATTLPEHALYRDEILFTPQSAPAGGTLQTRASSTVGAQAKGSVPGRADGSRLSNRDMLESASRQVSAIVNELDTELRKTRLAASKVLPRLRAAHSQLTQAQEAKLEAKQQLRDWEVDVTLNEWKKRFPEEIFGPMDDALRTRIERWVTDSKSRDPAADLDQTIGVVHDSAVFKNAKNEKEDERLEDALTDAYRADSRARTAYREARPDLINLYESRIVGLREAWELAQTATLAVKRALNAAPAAHGPQTSAPEVQRFAEELAGQADHALTQLYQALDAVPKMPSDGAVS